MNDVLGIAMPKVISHSKPGRKVYDGLICKEWPNVHLIGAFDFEQTESQIDINALAARYDDPNFWNRALIEAPDDPLA